MSVKVALDCLHEAPRLPHVNPASLLPRVAAAAFPRTPSHAAPQLPRVLAVHREGHLKRRHRRYSPEHFQVLDVSLCVAVGPQRHKPLQAGVVDLQRTEAAVESPLKPGFDQRGEIFSPFVAEERQTGEVFRKRVEIFRTAVDARQPAAPD